MQSFKRPWWQVCIKSEGLTVSILRDERCVCVCVCWCGSCADWRVAKRNSCALTSPCVGGGHRQWLLEGGLQVQQVVGCLGVAEGKTKVTKEKSVTHLKTLRTSTEVWKEGAAMTAVLCSAIQLELNVKGVLQAFTCVTAAVISSTMCSFQSRGQISI